MAGNSPSPKGGQPALQSVSRGPLRGWRAAALLILAGALALAYVGRFGLPDLEAGASPSPSPTAVAEPSASPAQSDGPSLPPGSSAAPTPDRAPPPAVPGRRADGIPSRIGEEPVLSVDEVLAMDRADDTEVLVGGWYHEGRLRDRIGRPSEGMLRVRGAGQGHGPIVARGEYSDIHLGERIFDVSEVLWSGDLQTDAAPISVMPLLDALVVRYYDRDPLGVDPVALSLADVALDCPIAWPRHSYAAENGPVRLALVFSTPIDRLIAEAAITHSQYPSAGDPTRNCPHPLIRTSARTRWIVDGNVMLLIRGGPHNTRLARQALAEAREQSERPEEGWRPVTSWQALRGLWSLLPDLDVAPAAEEVFCALGLPADSWSLRDLGLRDLRLRGLAVFDSTEAREDFQLSTPATDVRIEKGACTSLGGQRPIDPDARWLGKENVLLLITGRDAIDTELLDALPQAMVRVW